MQPLFDWLIKELQNPAKAAGGMLGSALGLIALFVARVFFERKRLDKAYSSIPSDMPKALPMPKRPPDLREDLTGRVVLDKRHQWQHDDDLASLRALAAELTAECDRNVVSITRRDSQIRRLGEELRETEATVLSLRQRLRDSEDRTRALITEVERMQRQIDASHTRLAPTHPKTLQARLPHASPPSFPPHVVEIDLRPIEDIKTPTQGRGRVRR